MMASAGMIKEETAKRLYGYWKSQAKNTKLLEHYAEWDQLPEMWREYYLGAARFIREGEDA